MISNKSDLIYIRAAFILILSAIAGSFQPFSLSPLFSAGLGLATGLLVVFIELRLRTVPLKQLVAAVFGMWIGSLLGISLVALLAFSSFNSKANTPFLQLAVPLCVSYLGLLVGISKAELLNLNAIGLFNRDTTTGSTLVKVLDTSVLIDGRIADIAEAGFLDGSLVVPQFVLRELQMVADSSDSAKRARGRRGLDVLQRLQKMPNATVELVDHDFPNVKEVDLKLLELGKVLHCRVVTNDFNLNKVAQVHGVQVMNINELANALKPVVLPGEIMRVFILKEGKEHNQGVAYLDDGTMVVVDNARRYISRTIDISVTSVLQTTAGKMIFGRYEEQRTAAHHPPDRQATAVPASPAPISTSDIAGKESQFA